MADVRVRGRLSGGGRRRLGAGMVGEGRERRTPSAAFLLHPWVRCSQALQALPREARFTACALLHNKEHFEEPGLPLPSTYLEPARPSMRGGGPTPPCHRLPTIHNTSHNTSHIPSWSSSPVATVTWQHSKHPVVYPPHLPARRGTNGLCGRELCFQVWNPPPPRVPSRLAGLVRKAGTRRYRTHDSAQGTCSAPSSMGSIGDSCPLVPGLG